MKPPQKTQALPAIMTERRTGMLASKQGAQIVTTTSTLVSGNLITGNIVSNCSLSAAGHAGIEFFKVCLGHIEAC